MILLIVSRGGALTIRSHDANYANANDGGSGSCLGHIILHNEFHIRHVEANSLGD